MLVASDRHVHDPVLPLACRHLAARVIDQALKDVRRPGGPPADRESARRFLAGSPMLHYWCNVAGLQVQHVIEFAALLDSPRPSPAGVWLADGGKRPARRRDGAAMRHGG
jgi:hypothetical protein